MRYLVTGSAGFLGSSLLSQLLQNGESVAVLLRSTSELWRIQHLLPQCHVIFGNFNHVSEFRDRIIEYRPEVVFHLAWTGGNSGRYQNDLTQIKSNLLGALDLLQAASDAGVRRWIGIGSGFEYGQHPGLLTESVQPKPDTLYAIGKYSLCLGSAKMCALLNLEHLWVRPFALYGTGDDPQGLIPFVTKMLLHGKRPALTAGEQEWDYLHVKDAANALALLALAPAAHGVYNLASGEAQAIRSLVERLRDMIDPSLPLGFGEIAYHPDQIMNLRADVSKLRDAVHWTPQISLEEGLSGIISEFSGNSPSVRQP